jgi:hypothetical protein
MTRALPAVAAAVAAATIAAGVALWWIWGPTVALAVLAQFCL